MDHRLVLRSDPLVPLFAYGVVAALLFVATAGSAGAGVEIGLNFAGRVGPAGDERAVRACGAASMVRVAPGEASRKCA